MANRSELDRFMSYVDKCSTGCWLWTGFRMKNGYGQFSHRVRSDPHELAHRASFRLFKGTIEPGMEILHACDTPSCVNPDHLSVGTRIDNMQDAKRKGRNARGEHHGRSKLTAEAVLAIRNSTDPQKEVAAQFSISQKTVSEIRLRQKWAHL